MTDLRCVVEFDDQLVIVQRRCSNPGPVLAKGVQEDGLYKLLVDLVTTLVHDNYNLCELFHKNGSLELQSIAYIEGYAARIIGLQDQEDKGVQPLCTQQACQDCFPKQWA